MNIPTQAELIRQIDDFLDRHDMKPSRLAREATGEPGLIDAIRESRRSPTLATVEKLATYMKRKDAELAVNPPPLELVAEEEEIPLPFASAPVNRTGASSQTCSKTNERQQPSAVNGSCRSSSATRASTDPNPSCSGDA